MIPLFQPSIGPEEKRAVADVLESLWLGKGNVTDRFEAAWAERLKVPKEHLVSTNSATSALFSVVQLASWNKGDEVILPSISFVGAANAVAAVGARPIFADVDPLTLNLTYETFAAKVTPKTRGLLLLHYGGYPCRDLPKIADYCTENRITLVVDNACSPLTLFQGVPTGCWGDFGIWSFDAAKLLTNGDGGLIYAKRLEAAQKLRCLNSLGLTVESGLSNKSKSEWWNFDVTFFSGRAITNDLASAIGLEQLKKADHFNEIRRKITLEYWEALEKIPGLVLPPLPISETSPSYYMFWVQLKERNALAEYLRREGIYTSFRYKPFHLIPKYESHSSLPAAEQAGRCTLNLPLHANLTSQDIRKIVKAISDFQG